jgi:hypothetical protein
MFSFFFLQNFCFGPALLSRIPAVLLNPSPDQCRLRGTEVEQTLPVLQTFILSLRRRGNILVLLRTFYLFFMRELGSVISNPK